MEAKELRIGNYVDFCGISKILELHSEKKQFDNVYLECEESFEWGEYERLRPIPLTEEILLKCGFKLFSSGSYCKNLITDSCAYLAFDLKFNNGFCWLNIQYGKVENTTKISCSYIHQLQNLYFALTNEELTVNL